MTAKLDLLMLGIDGVSGLYLLRYLNSYPTFKKLSKEGKLGVHRSILSDDIVPHSGPCWSTIYTGVEPKIHGITSGGWTRGEQYFTNIKTITIFDIIGDAYSEWLFNMPITWPPRPINGYIISGFPTSGKDYCYPKWLEKELPEWYKPEFIPPPNAGYVELIKAKEFEMDKLHLFFDLYKKYPTNVVFLGTSIVDVLCHRNDYSVYYFIDNYVKEVIDFFDYKNLVMTSDHGFKSTQHYIDAFYYTSNKEESNSIIDIPKIILKMLGLYEKWEKMNLVQELEKKRIEDVVARRMRKKDKNTVKKNIKNTGCCK